MIRELYTPITTQKGFFLSGKFDQLNKGLAYTALADALKNFVRQCLGQDKDTIAVWRTVIQVSVGEFGQVLTDIVPDFRNLIGKQPNIAPVSPLETVARRNLVFSNLIKDICAIGRPLVLFLDDLQWADLGSISLLLHLGRRIETDHILIVGAYRKDEIMHGQNGEVHPLTRVVTELKRKFGEIEIDLEQTDAIGGRHFVDAFLDTEPNRLGEEFRQALHGRTGGHALFTIELLRQMETQGDLQPGDRVLQSRIIRQQLLDILQGGICLLGAVRSAPEGIIVQIGDPCSE